MSFQIERVIWRVILNRNSGQLSKNMILEIYRLWIIADVTSDVIDIPGNQNNNLRVVTNRGIHDWHNLGIFRKVPEIWPLTSLEQIAYFAFFFSRGKNDLARARTLV